MLLLSAVGIMVRSAHGLLEPRERPQAFTLGVLVAVIVVKELLFRFVSREAGSLQSIALFTDAWHHRIDALTSLAAGLGISLALFGGPRLAFADDAAAIVAGAVI